MKKATLKDTTLIGVMMYLCINDKWAHKKIISKKKQNTNTISPISMKRKKERREKQLDIIITSSIHVDYTKMKSCFVRKTKKRKKTTQTDKGIMNYQKDLLLR